MGFYLNSRTAYALFENEVRIDLPESGGKDAEPFLQALRLHLALLQQDYSENLQLTDTEV